MAPLRIVAAAALLGMAFHAGAQTPLLLNADTLDNAQLEPSLMLPDETALIVDPSAITIDARPQSVLVYQPQDGTFRSRAHV